MALFFFELLITVREYVTPSQDSRKQTELRGTNKHVDDMEFFKCDASDL